MLGWGSMRLGCGGCLVAILAALLAAGILTVLAVVGFRVVQGPHLAMPAVSRADGVRAQQKLYRLVSGGPGRGRAGEVITLTERETQAFLAGHMETAAWPFHEIRVRLAGEGIADLAVRMPLGELLRDPPLAPLGRLLPRRWLAFPVWLQARVRAEVAHPDRGRPYLRLEPRELMLGRQPLPAWTLRLLVGPDTLRTLHWPLPAGVEDVTVEAERLVLRTSRRGAAGAWLAQSPTV
jgi:hypothetical protein